MENKGESAVESVIKQGDATSVPFVLSKSFQIFFRKGLTNIQCCVIIYSTKEMQNKVRRREQNVKRYGANKATEFTRKQINVLYRLAKQGELKIEKWVMSVFYDLSDYYGYDDNGSIERCEQQIKQILDFVFSENMEEAQEAINEYTEERYALLGRICKEQTDRSLI